eukprot:GEMP01050116.1.p1 GENE.GEMP01050116.1~~GEMP01050116.1.p1  ORF type:complete len:172 (+),score=37.57 GEMP01050116.1:245-760(+)
MVQYWFVLFLGALGEAADFDSMDMDPLMEEDSVFAPAPSPPKEMKAEIPVMDPPRHMGEATKHETKLPGESHETAIRRQLSEHMRQLEASHVDHRSGVWLYGDYKSVKASDAITCSQICDSDDKCYHWNFSVGGDECALKRNSGGFNNDRKDWVSGHSHRFINVQMKGGEL